MAQAELVRRMVGLPDLELAMMRAHAAAPVAGPARAELLRRHPQLTSMTNESIRAAIKAFCEEDDSTPFGAADFRHSPKAEAKYGPVGLWDVSEVKRMDVLFYKCTNLNEDISAWDVRLGMCARTDYIFVGAAAFDRAANAPWYTAPSKWIWMVLQ